MTAAITSYVATGWAVAAAVVAGYAARLLWRGRALARRVPEDELPWR